jgi:hypothetical protein
MAKMTRELLAGYLEDSLNDSETAAIEKALRENEPLRRLLRALMVERDRGEHSIGAIWCRHRLSCPSREQLGSYLLGALDSGLQDYIDFHLKTVACAFCAANLSDLEQRQESAPKVQQRRQRFFESSAGLLSLCKTGKKG